MTEANEERQEWYFTFGWGQPHQNCYTVFYGTFAEAREKMFDKYGRTWCMQYSSKEEAGVDRFGLTEI